MLTAICDVLKEAYKRDWLTTRDGNISIRRKDKFYITPSGVRKDVLRVEDLIKGIYNQNTQEFELDLKGLKPSGELLMHQYLQRTHSGTKTVLHLHPPFTIACMFAGHDLEALSQEFPELSRYTKVGPTVEKLNICSKDLATRTFENMTDNRKIVYDIVGQDGHGVCAIDTDPWSAFEHVERLEHICKIVMLSGVKAYYLEAKRLELEEDL